MHMPMPSDKTADDESQGQVFWLRASRDATGLPDPHEANQWQCALRSTAHHSGASASDSVFERPCFHGWRKPHRLPFDDVIRTPPGTPNECRLQLHRL
jgi:hypothetical protein